MEHKKGEGEYISKGFVGSILWRIKKVTAPLLLPHQSEPIEIEEEDLQFLERKLERIGSTLKDYANLETGYGYVKLWLRELKELQRYIEDVIEELQFESLWKPRMQHLRCQLRKTADNNDIIAGKRKRDEISFLFSSRPGKSLDHKVGKIKTLYNEIASDREALYLREGDGVMIRPHHFARSESTSHPASQFSNFHGRKNEFDAVMNSLLSKTAHEQKISVIAVVGMAGVGKTTLTQHVFNSEKVRLRFDERMWICMSEGLNAEKVTRNIRDNLVKESCDPERSLDLLQKDIMTALRGKRFLLVLDDLWSDEFWRCHWEVIQTPLKVATRGSRVIVTTTDRKIVNNVGSEDYHHLRCLSDSDCWLIFLQNAFNGQKQNVHPEILEEISKVISNKCKGLPLAAKVIGQHLYHKNIEYCDRECLKSMPQDENFFCPDEFETDILPQLELSYKRLPTHLKYCYPYCSLFPKSYAFEKDQLVRLWMAQGFVEPKQGSKLEDTGNKYFDELVHTSLLQCDPNEERYVMHDLFQDLAQYVASHECSKTESHKLGVHKKTWHSSLVLDDSQIKKGIEFEVTDGQDLRSLLLITRNGYSGTPFHVQIPVDLCVLVQCLRALDLSNTDMEELPVSIGSLIHLRYLGLRNTKIKRLPQSICGLFKLQTLDLRHCVISQDLQEGITILSDMQHELLKRNTNVQFSSTICVLRSHKMEAVFSKMDLKEFSGIGKSRDMVNLTRDLQIAELKSVVDAGESDGGLLKRIKRKILRN